MKFDEKTQKKIQELQHYEHTLQNLLMQKQAFQIEMNEAQNALTEIKDSKDDIYKMVGQILVKADKEKVMKDLKQKEDLLKIRIKSLEQQEEHISKELDVLKEEVMKKIK